MGVSAIAIVLGNNSYGNTFRPLLQSVRRAIEYHGEITREQAAWMIRNGIDWHYQTFQNLANGEPARGVLGYLGSVQILFDDAARADAASKDHDGGAWFLSVDTGEIQSY